MHTMTILVLLAVEIKEGVLVVLDFDKKTT